MDQPPDQLSSGLKTYETLGSSGEGENHRLRIAAKHWAAWCINNTIGERLEKGLLISCALADYAALDDEEDHETNQFVDKLIGRLHGDPKDDDK